MHTLRPSQSKEINNLRPYCFFQKFQKKILNSLSVITYIVNIILRLSYSVPSVGWTRFQNISDNQEKRLNVGLLAKGGIYIIA